MDRGGIRERGLDVALMLQRIQKGLHGFGQILAQIGLDLVVDHLFDDPRMDQPVLAEEAVAHVLHRVLSEECFAEHYLVEITRLEPFRRIRALPEPEIVIGFFH